MRTAKAIILFISINGLILVINSCKNETPSPKCTTAVDQVNTTAGGSIKTDNYLLNIGSGSINFNNLNVTFYGEVTVDAGNVCLDSLKLWPGNGTTDPVNAVVGHVYVVSFYRTLSNGSTLISYSKFVVNDIKDGVVAVTYVPHLF